MKIVSKTSCSKVIDLSYFTGRTAKSGHEKASNSFFVTWHGSSFGKIREIDQFHQSVAAILLYIIYFRTGRFCMKYYPFEITLLIRERKNQ